LICGLPLAFRVTIGVSLLTKVETDATVKKGFEGIN
jgi:hypothetical protein